MGRGLGLPLLSTVGSLWGGRSAFNVPFGFILLGPGPGDSLLGVLVWPTEFARGRWSTGVWGREGAGD
jgi:hypothetical protein